MRVLHILSGPLTSGAGRGARALHEALLDKGVNSRLIGRIEDDLPDDLNATTAPMRTLLPVSLGNKLYLKRLRRRFGPVRYFHPISHGLALHRTKEYRAADVIHIQWAAAPTLGPAFWRHLATETRPVLWTLRDMWAITGGCHFSAECRGYETGCVTCPQLGDQPQTITRRDIAFKRDHFGPSSFVAISRYIAGLAEASIATQGRRIEVIPNSVDAAQFANTDQAAARAVLGLDPDVFIVGVGALNLSEPRKGSETLRLLLERWRDRRDIHWLAFGKHLDRLIDPLPENCTWYGPLSDNAEMNRIYAAADLFLMPSLQETFGKVTVEAHYAQTPVLAYADTPADEILTEETGWTVPLGDAEAMATALDQIHALPRETLAQMGCKARASALARYSADSVADQHIALYEALLAESAAGTPTKQKDPP